ncbi:hypothetical protein [Limnofasciculus baicalensis]|uniref:DUF11 domain-containing protein n=1 Tax=Limnofasciculus baicalensis BBK-W-15 TaxID=2699891 RepID=A0AAE3KN05_9CYAN|nr:hypothetical protein [Limnofasciculus baicalensis]MCP2729331.1 hypothetical protein [Limnofasciculus baicalensis BBK-W-15]
MTPRKRKRSYPDNKWFQCLTTTVLIGTILNHSTATIAQVQETKSLQITNQASYSYSNTFGRGKRVFESTTNQISVTPIPLVDPFGQILGCNGEPLPDYTGFTVGLYEPNSSDLTGTELGRLVTLTPTELPDIQGNNIPGGKQPNIQNINPYPLTNTNKGLYNFLFDPNKGQTNAGKTYILVINPPANSIYQQRRVKIDIVESTGAINNSVIRYIATSLDGQPISSTGETRVENQVVFVPNAETVGLDLLAFQFTTLMCEPNQISIVKTGDRVAAQPGDVVIYRLTLRNKSDANLKTLVVTDSLPLGFQFVDKSVRGEFKGQSVNVSVEGNGRTITFRTDTSIPPDGVLNIAYAAELTPDSRRGSGKNSAIVQGQRGDNGFKVKDGPATYQLKIEPGIISDCGTLIGRVFVDKNFDGEQQSGEPGVPNAVIFMEDGNRITTDPNGLFSVANVLPGNHTGVLDLSSLPGYTLAPNNYFSERNSQSRLVRLEPGGLARMNFAVTPTSQEQNQ